MTGNVLDAGDAYTSRYLGSGTTSVTQWDAAKALVDYVLSTLAGGVASKVVVTGQSMGGGLAGLASAYFGVQGDVFAPAPYAAQLHLEAVRKALDTFLQANGGYFNGDFGALSPNEKVSLLASPSFVTFSDYLLVSTPQSYAAMLDALTAATRADETKYANNITSFLHVERVDGETLSSSTGLGLIIQANSSQFKPADKTYQIGDASDEGKHSPALHALLVRTDESTNQKFEALLLKDQILRYSIVGEPSGFTSPTMSTVSAPIDHGRIGPAYDASKLISTGPNSYLMEDALWKSYGDSGGLYDYFYKFFNITAAAGAAANGMGSSSSTRFSVHDGVVQLALQVLRDAIQDTNTLDQVKVKLGGAGAPTWNFGGGETSGTPFADKVVIQLSQITATDAQLKIRTATPSASATSIPTSGTKRGPSRRPRSFPLLQRRSSERRLAYP